MADFKIPEPAGYWRLDDGRLQPVADLPRWAEKLYNYVFYGWEWIPYQCPAAEDSGGKK